MTKPAECSIDVKVTELQGGKIKVELTSKDCSEDVSVALYSYVDDGPAEYDVNKEQTLLGTGPNHVTITDAECGVDFQGDAFTGEVIDPLGPNTEHYSDNGRLVDYVHVDGIECPPPSTTTSTTSTIPSTTTSTTSTIQPTTTTSSTTAPSTTSPPPVTATPFPEYTCEMPWVGANRDILADNFLEVWEHKLDTDGNGIICETSVGLSTVVTVADPTTSGVLPFTGGYEVDALQVGLGILALGLSAFAARVRLAR